MNDPLTHPMQIVGVAELVQSGAFVMSELLRAIAEDGGPIRQQLSERLAAGEQPVLTVRLMPDNTGTIIELITQMGGGDTFTRIAGLPIFKNTGSSIN